MGIAGYLVDKIIDNAATIAGGAALATAGAVGGYAAKAIIDDKKFQEKSKDIYELGVKKGTKMGGAKARKIFVDPIIAKIALLYCIALADGKLSRTEKKKIDEMVKGITSNPEFPKSAIKEIDKIVTDESITFEKVYKYLDKISIETLSAFADDINEIANASKGISYQERAIIDEYERYLISRTGQPNDANLLELRKSIEGSLTIQNEKDLDEYFSHFVQKDEIEIAVEEFSIRMKLLDQSFKRKTKLDAKEIGLLMVAVSLQCVRIYLIYKFSQIEKANHGEREDFLHKQQKKVLEKLDRGKDKIAKPYYAPLNEIISIAGVPYDTTSYADKKLGLFSGEHKGEGVNHRFATLGHDPLIGLVVGTTNIMTNTITTTKSTSLVSQTNHVVYDAHFRNPRIAGNASFPVALSKVIERSQEDLTPLVASFVKQLIHIMTDMYTPAGIQLPGANLVFDRRMVEELTKYVSTGDMVKIGVSAAVDELINKMVEILHGCMLVESGIKLDSDLNRVKTKKIVLYSNAIATGSNVITEYVTANYKNIDFAGLIVLLRRVFSDIDFIYDVKFEFLKNGLEDL